MGDRICECGGWEGVRLLCREREPKGSGLLPALLAY